MHGLPLDLGEDVIGELELARFARGSPAAELGLDPRRTRGRQRGSACVEAERGARAAEQRRSSCAHIERLFVERTELAAQTTHLLEVVADDFRKLDDARPELF